MDRVKALELLQVYGRPCFKTNGGNLFSFARQSIQDIEEIEKMTTEELIDNWKGLCTVNHFYSCVSLNELQRIDLLELEMDCRTDINYEELKEWYNSGIEEAKKREQIEEEEYKKEQEK